MKARELKIRKGLWVAASLLMFGVCWLYPMYFSKEGTYPLGKAWSDFFRDCLLNFYGVPGTGKTLNDWLPLLFLSSVFGILAALVGFAVQALAVIVQEWNAQPGAPPNGGPAAPSSSSEASGEGRHR
jgi:hypothetical protein